MITKPAGAVKTARKQLNLATRHQLAGAGVPDGTNTSRTRPGGPWQRLLPRVYLLQTGPPDRRQRALAAVLYAAEPAADPLSGDTAALTGGAALALLGIRDAPHTPADVLVRAPRRLTGTREVRPLPTARWPRTITVSGIPSTRPVRAAADFAARADDPADIRSILAHVIQAGWCHPQDLHTELRAARLLTRPAIGAAAAELLVGVRSVAEAQARDTLTATDLPPPCGTTASTPRTAPSWPAPTPTGPTRAWPWRSTRRSTTTHATPGTPPSAAASAWSPTASWWSAPPPR
ncbi:MULTISPECIES: hypothetical protein [unclassified Streptomyces]|uniref:hypothetical protein n=1 Tax=unclassified Streptomyces TaxID=2593676 RepID=UPI001BE79574|nr:MULTISPECIES: hypothetical protein [unclassified Streptomyces]MBT2402650.1 hypothetical protein [Streptomyces sp. ISL-21]MBT2608043.1 hypothetical protein [Streptomyces sp. ISL-87]